MVKQFSICNLAFFSFTLCNEWISKASIALIRSNLVGFQGFEFRLQEQFQVTRVTGRVREREYMHVCHGATCSVYTLLRQTPEMSGTQVLRCSCQGRLQAPGFENFNYCQPSVLWESCLLINWKDASLNMTSCLTWNRKFVSQTWHLLIVWFEIYNSREDFNWITTDGNLFLPFNYILMLNYGFYFLGELILYSNSNNNNLLKW